jgi:hypothetical protein
MYQPELGRFLQPDPKHFAAGDYNLYRYCHNDPVNKSDPTGTYGRGLGFSDQQWKQFQSAQNVAINAITNALKNLNVKTFEKTFGPGSGTAAKMGEMTKMLQGMRTALADNGRNGYYANAVTQGVIVRGLGTESFGHVDPRDPCTMYVNVSSPGFNNVSATAEMAVHESGHSMGLRDVGVQGITAYRHGDSVDQQFFRELPFRDPNGALMNSDTVTSLVFP